MGNHSRNRCERHRWVEGAWDHWSALWPSSVSGSVAKVHAGSVRLAFIIIVSLLGAFLLSAVGSVSEAEAGASIIRFDGGSKIQRLRIPVDKSDTIRLEQPFAEALVGDSEIADVIPLTNQSLYVLGKKIGATRLTILDGEKSVLGIVEIEISYDVVGIRAQIHEALPQARVKVKSANGRIVLSGLVPDAPTLERAVSIAEQFAPKAVLATGDASCWAWCATRETRAWSRRVRKHQIPLAMRASRQRHRLPSRGMCTAREKSCAFIFDFVRRKTPQPC